MCGACGVATPVHWSAPFLASQPARATAARAIHAMIGPSPAVVGVPGGFLIRRPTGAAAVVPHLGAVWRELDRIGVPRPTATRPPLDVTGPVTLPPVRTTVLDVDLVLCDQATAVLPTGSDAPGIPAAAGNSRSEQHIDGRGVDSNDLIARLHALITSKLAGSAARLTRLVLASTDLPRTLPHLAASPARPYQLRLDPSTARDGPEQWAPWLGCQPAAGSRVPAVLAWAAARHGQGHPERLAVRLPIGDKHNVQLEILAGTVIRCSLEPRPMPLIDAV